MNNLDRSYQALVFDILNNGRAKGDRTGTGTLAVFGREIRHNMADGFPLLTTKKMSLDNIKAELIWFLRGDTNIKYLVERGCNIWNGDAYKHYKTQVATYTYNVANEMGWCKGDIIDGIVIPFTMKEFIEKIKTDERFSQRWGELGPIYGKQWRDFGGVDQIEEILDTLRNNPDSRRMMVNAWNVGELPRMTLPPCHFGFQLYTEELTWEERRDLLSQEDREGFGLISPFTERIIHIWLDHKNIPKRRISLKWYQRSVDVGLGLPYNIASYGLLLLMFANEVGMQPGELIGTLGDTHLYQNHVELIKPQLFLKPFKLPDVQVHNGVNSDGDREDIRLWSYTSHPPITLPLSN